MGYFLIHSTYGEIGHNLCVIIQTVKKDFVSYCLREILVDKFTGKITRFEKNPYYCKSNSSYWPPFTRTIVYYYITNNVVLDTR